MLNVLHAAALSFSSRPPTVAVASPRVASASVKMATDLSVDLTRPSYLDGTLAADSGFDPLRLTAKYRQGLKLSLMLNPETSLPFSTATAACKPTDVFLGPNTHDEAKALIWFRESEIKHARLAMLAAVGWPLAELWHGGLSRLSGGQYLLDVTHGRSLSVLNGGLGEVLPFLVLATLGAAFVECSTLDQVHGMTATGLTLNSRGQPVMKTYVPGDCGFDPLGLYGIYTKQLPAMETLRAKQDPEYALKLAADARRVMETAEIQNGRLAMLAITGYAMQELIYGTPVVDQTPLFFTFFGELLAPGSTPGFFD